MRLVSQKTFKSMPNIKKKLNNYFKIKHLPKEQKINLTYL